MNYRAAMNSGAVSDQPNNDVETALSQSEMETESSLKGIMQMSCCMRVDFALKRVSSSGTYTELCHARILQKCGAAVVEGFSKPNLALPEKCRIREVHTRPLNVDNVHFLKTLWCKTWQNFLHCVIKMKRRTCRERSRQELYMTEETIRSLRQQMLTLLWFVAVKHKCYPQYKLMVKLFNTFRSARGCVLGMEAP